MINNLIFKKAVIIFCVAVIFFSFASVYFYNKAGSISRDVKPLEDTQVTRADYVSQLPLPTTNENFATDGISKYLTQLQLKIDSLSESQSFEKDLTKIIYYNLLPSSKLLDNAELTDRILLSTDSYNNLFAIANKYKDSTDKHTRDALYTKAKMGILEVYESSCFMDEPIEKSAIGSNSEYKLYKQKYSGKLSIFMYFNNYISDVYTLDKYTASVYLMNSAHILDNFSNELSPEERNAIVVKMSEVISTFDKLPETILFGNNQSIKVASEINVNYSYGYQVLSNFDKKITEEDVIKNYEEKIEVLNQIVSTTQFFTDVSYRNWLIFMYSGYLFEKNGNIVNDKIKSNLATFMELDTSPLMTKESMARRTFYLVNSQTDIANWDGIRKRALPIALKYKPFKDYLEGKGLKF